MFSNVRIAAVAAAVTLFAAVPAVAAASGGNKYEMRGVVSGSPYGASGGQMAIPVLFSKMTARNTGLKSPVGVIIVKRTQQVKLPNGGGTTIPVNLRTGDRFKGIGVVGDLQQKVFYPRVVFPKATVYFRSKELSLSELSAAVASLQSSLAALQAQLNALRDGSVKAFQDIYAQLDSLRKALAALQGPAASVDLSSLQTQIDALNKKVNDLIAGLPDFSKFALITQLPDLSAYAKLTDLTSAIAGLASTSYVDSQINAVKALLPSSVLGGTGTLATTSDVTNAVSGLATTAYVNGQVATLKSKINEIATDFNTLCSQIDGAGVALIATAVTCPTLNTLP